MTALTVQEVASALPPAFKQHATPQLVAALNSLPFDPVAAEQVRENFITYTSVLADGRYKMMDYLNAVTFVSLRMMGKDNKEAYSIVFPNRIASLVAKGTSQKDIASYVSMYGKGKLVMAIMEQTLIPVWLLNVGTYQDAINTQAQLMNDVNQPGMVRTAAANSILTHLAKPKETVQNKLEINIQESDGTKEMAALLKDLAQKQLQAISQGMTARDVAAVKLAEVVDV